MHKEGEKFEIIKEIGGHGFKIGEVVEIVRAFPTGGSDGGPHYKAKGKTGTWYVNNSELKRIEEEIKVKKLNANIVDHIGSKVTVWTKDGNAAENRDLHTVDEFGIVISNFKGGRTFIPWVQVKYVDYMEEV